MGIYLNPGNENFRRTLAGRIYVDKTMMISVINSFIDRGNNYLCVSRPRRFGKTIAGNMLAAYYSRGCDSAELFSGLKIAKTSGFREKLNKYHVIKLDMNSEYQNTLVKGEMLIKLTRKIKKEMEKQFAEVALDEDDTLAESILKIYAETGETFIILIDEYDVLVRENVEGPLFSEYLNFLNGLFKSDTLRPAISMAYLTGILPIVRDKIQSKLNNFKEYTILSTRELSSYVGFTEEEVKELCERYGMDFAECRRWYDGYHLGGEEIYNPESVVRCMEEHAYGGYWGMTSSYEVITDGINQNFAGAKEGVIRMLAGEHVSMDPGMYLNTMNCFKTKDDLFTYLCHVGYLAYDKDSENCYIPNGEVRREWLRAISVADDYEVTDGIVKASKELLEQTLKGDKENEDALQSAIYLAYIYALNRYTIVKEMTTGHGFADVVFIPYVPDIPAMIIELKHNKSAEGALNQIRRKQYFDSLTHYQGKLLFVGINYDEKEKTHTCEMEWMEK